MKQGLVLLCTATVCRVETNRRRYLLREREGKRLADKGKSVTGICREIKTIYLLYWKFLEIVCSRSPSLFFPFCVSTEEIHLSLVPQVLLSPLIAMKNKNAEGGNA